MTDSHLAILVITLWLSVGFASSLTLVIMEARETGMLLLGDLRVLAFSVIGPIAFLVLMSTLNEQGAFDRFLNYTLWERKDPPTS